MHISTVSDISDSFCEYDEILEINELTDDDLNVCDFETESPNHSFITASGFCVSNCSMGKQALGVYHSNHHLRFDTTMKMLVYPSRPLFETQIYSHLGLNQMPAGQMVILAIAAYTGYNQEDSLIFNQGAINRGLFRMVVYRSYKSIQVQSREIRELIMHPKPTRTEDEAPDKFAALDENGIARLGAVVKPGDIIIGKQRTILKTGQVEYANTVVGIGEGGIVDKILITTNDTGWKLVKVKIREHRIPIAGDKFASRHAQKATIGMILPEADMPFAPQRNVEREVMTRTGERVRRSVPVGAIRPDLIMNPHAIPSRMTIGKMIEIVTSKVGALKGERINATAFQPFELDEFRRNLVAYGFNSYGNETLYGGFEGKPMQAQIFMGPCYYQALRHHVKDKIQMRARGGIKAVTHQPVSGRQRRGGLRMGEMERDCILSHGGTSFLLDRFCHSSDAYKAVFCQTCGSIAIPRAREDRVICRKCGDKGSFGQCQTPRPYLVLTHFLAGLGFRMTSDFKEVERRESSQQTE